MPLDEFTSMIGKNSKLMGSLGGTVTQGAMQFAQMSKEMRVSDFGTKMMGMGMTMGDLNDYLSGYLEIQQRTGKVEGKSQQELISGAKEYALEMDKLTKVTGVSRQQTQDALRTAMKDGRLLNLSSKLSGQALSNFQKGIALVSTTMDQSVMGTLTNMMSGVIDPGDKFGKILTQAAPGIMDFQRAMGEGKLSIEESIEGYKDQEAAIGNYLNNFSKEAIARSSELTKLKEYQSTLQKFRNMDVKAAAEEQRKQNKVTEALGSFQQMWQKFVGDLTVTLIDSGVFKALESGVQILADKFLKYGPQISTAITGLVGDLDTAFQSDDLMTGIGNAFGVLFDKLTPIVGALFKGLFESLTGKSGKRKELEDRKKQITSKLQNASEDDPDNAKYGEELSKVKKELEEMDNIDPFKELSKTLTDMFPIIGKIQNIVATVESVFSDWGTTILAGGGIVVGLTLLSKIIGGAGSGIGVAISGLSKGVGDLVGNVSKGVGTAISSLSQGIGTTISSLSKGIGEMIVNISTGVGSAISSLSKGIGEMIANISTGVGTAISSLAQGIGDGISKIGKGIGTAIGGILEGLAGGLKAFANPQVLIGSGILGASIIAIGAGIAGATWLMGKALPTFAEGLKSFADLDGDNLVNVAKGIGAIGVAMAAMGTGSAISGVGGMLGGLADGITSLFGGKTPFDKLQEFSQLNIDANKVEANATAVVAYSKAMAALGGGGAIGSLGGLVSGAVDGLVNFFGGNTSVPWDKVQAFQSITLDGDRIESNAKAVVAYMQAMASLGAGNAVGSISGLVSAIADGLSSFFGGSVKLPWDKLLEFQSINLDIDKIRANTEAMISFADVMKNIPEIKGEQTGGLINSITSFFTGGQVMPWDKLKEFGELKIDGDKIRQNAEILSIFGNSLKTFQGGDSAGIGIPDKLIDNLKNLSVVASKVSADGFIKLMNSIVSFGNLNSTNIDAVVTSIGNVKTVVGGDFASQAAGVNTFTDSIKNLNTAINELNTSLGSISSAGKGVFGGGKSNLEVVSQSLGGANTGSSVATEKLNTLVTELVSLTKEIKDFSKDQADALNGRRNPI